MTVQRNGQLHMRKDQGGPRLDDTMKIEGPGKDILQPLRTGTRDTRPAVLLGSSLHTNYKWMAVVITENSFTVNKTDFFNILQSKDSGPKQFKIRF